MGPDAYVDSSHIHIWHSSGRLNHMTSRGGGGSPDLFQRPIANVRLTFSSLTLPLSMTSAHRPSTSPEGVRSVSVSPQLFVPFTTDT